MFLRFSVISFRASRLWHSANAAAEVTKMHQKWYQHLSKSIPKSSQIDQNGAQERPEKQLGSKLAQECAPETKLTCFLSPLGRFWAPFWAQVDAKGLPKSSIFAPSRCKCRKNEVQEGVPEKVWNFDWNLNGKCEVMKVPRPPKYFIYKHFVGFRWLWQNREFHENLCQNGSHKFPKKEENGRRELENKIRKQPEIKKCRKQDPETGKVNLEVRNWSSKIEGIRGPGIRVL